MSTLFVISTPIGNLEDLSPRAKRVLREVGLVIAEDTRVTRKLLNHIGSKAATTSLHQHSSEAALRHVLERLDSGDAALVTDAGTPGISDPGAELVRKAAGAGHQVVTVPGPAAVTAALSVSGFPADRFTFGGFLSRKQAERRTEIEAASGSPYPTVFYEAPHRVQAALRDMAAIFGDRELAVCRELTKLHEEVFRGTADEALAHFVDPRGEFVIAVSGKPPTSPAAISDETIRKVLAEGAREGKTGRDLVDWAASATGAPRRQVYGLAHERPSSAAGQKRGRSDSRAAHKQVP